LKKWPSPERLPGRQSHLTQQRKNLTINKLRMKRFIRKMEIFYARFLFWRPQVRSPNASPHHSCFRWCSGCPTRRLTQCSAGIYDVSQYIIYFPLPPAKNIINESVILP
jgi:hypothetical protein